MRLKHPALIMLVVAMFATTLFAATAAEPAAAQIDAGGCSAAARAAGDLRPGNHASCVGVTATSASYFFRPAGNTHNVNNTTHLTNAAAQQYAYRLDSDASLPKWNGPVENNQRVVHEMAANSLTPRNGVTSGTTFLRALDYILDNYGQSGRPTTAHDGTPLFGQYGSHSVQIAIYMLARSPVDADPVLAPYANDPGALALFEESLNQFTSGTLSLRSSHEDFERPAFNTVIRPVLASGATGDPLVRQTVTMAPAQLAGSGATWTQVTTETDINGQVQANFFNPTANLTDPINFIIRGTATVPTNRTTIIWDASDSGASETISDVSPSGMARIISSNTDADTISTDWVVGWDPRSRVSLRVFDSERQNIASSVTHDVRFSNWGLMDYASDIRGIINNTMKGAYTVAELAAIETALTPLTWTERHDYMWDNFQGSISATISDEAFVTRFWRNSRCEANPTASQINDELVRLAAVGGDRGQYAGGRVITDFNRRQQCVLPYVNTRWEGNTGTNGQVDLFAEAENLWAAELISTQSPWSLPPNHEIQTDFTTLGEFTAHFEVDHVGLLVLYNFNGNDRVSIAAPEANDLEVVTSTQTHTRTGSNTAVLNTGQAIEPNTNVSFRIIDNSPEWDNYWAGETYVQQPGRRRWVVGYSFPSVDNNPVVVSNFPIGQVASPGDEFTFSSVRHVGIPDNFPVDYRWELDGHSGPPTAANQILAGETIEGSVFTNSAFESDLITPSNQQTGVGLFSVTDNLPPTNHLWYEAQDFVITWDRKDRNGTHTVSAVGAIPNQIDFRTIADEQPALTFDMITSPLINVNEPSTAITRFETLLENVSQVDSGGATVELRGPYLSPSEYETTDPNNIVVSFDVEPGTTPPFVASDHLEEHSHMLTENGFYFWHIYDAEIDQLSNGITNPLSFDDHNLLVINNPPLSNVALAGTATQSTTNFSSQTADRAIDGINGSSSSLAVTDGGDDSPWWQVDLGSSQTIHSINVWNRPDYIQFGGLEDFTVSISDSPFDPNATRADLLADPNVWNFDHPSASVSEEIEIPVQTQGRYVRIDQDEDFLTIAEVEVNAPDPTYVPIDNTPLLTDFDFQYTQNMQVTAVAIPASGGGTVLPGVGLEALSNVGGFQTVIATGTTDSNGLFTFTAPTNGEYCVRQTSVPVGFIVSPGDRCTPGILSSTLGNSEPNIFTTVIGEGGLPMTGVEDGDYATLALLLAAIGAAFVLNGRSRSKRLIG